jgi:outer membrane protein assembly factor BamB
MNRRASLIVAAIVLVGGMARAADWPEFRGPTGQGHAVGEKLPLEWGPDKNVAWKAAIPGSGWSSPVVVSDRVFLTAAVPAEANGDKADVALRSLCLDAETGRTLWDIEVFRQTAADAPRVHPKNSHASPTPLVSGDRVFVHFGHQGTACLNTSGKILWRNRDLKYPPVHGNGGSPILVDDLLVFSCDGASDPFIVALDARTGEVRWKTRREGDPVKKFAFSTPLLISVNGQRQIISPGSGSVGALDPKTGRELWRVRYDGYSVIPRPVFGHGLVFVSTGYDSPEVLAIRPNGSGDVTDTHVAWRESRGAPKTPSMLLVGEELYYVSDRGIASCVDAKTGKSHWQERAGSAFSASPIYANGRIYFQSEQGTGTVAKAGKKFEKLAENALGERTLASYAIAGGRIYIRSDKHLYCIAAGQAE